uniref:RNA polymerase Rpb7-like N-terminal domain-containing protein n=1 Tax=Neobodo designis TaxID=312471 RepID=A0A7S1QH19_NEODS|mmetsp:Transcript_46357/g.143023  ORF Transcript_46357/g.143023 Transcript_46357/m.143023 type:complete len:174 (+) Transcript_46357:64-585(+)|eukprot:CAMPEP_0174853750 /NCGR_PEP_ID=MMETSP1114-20130205/29553_1 /TAXON_ID=312471 /ORGANISM="Neobodo designis, Strain CCAP 1951/1" /LENGTH=173 /DNA_ID=CAMNT_0016088417 /DNA_START=63 /DNA_END=584 /DNA_ORIENTATION=-
MYVKVTERKNVYVPPEELGPQLTHRLEYLLRQRVEGTRVPNVGVIVGVTDIVNESSMQGKVLETGTVVFAMTYTAIAFRLAPDEVCDGRVCAVSPESIMVDVGAAKIRVSRFHIPPELVYEGDGGSPRFVSTDSETSITEGCTVRVRVVSETPTNTLFGAIGTINGPFLGLKL